ncbi:hypothetical protein MHU86_9150 [Fragilaria crotonensis]|nr:hypothetical protein MHU86_9150 [Fragilaria crotonensis]
MFEAGRLLVREAPKGSTAGRKVMMVDTEDVPSYEELLSEIARDCEGFRRFACWSCSCCCQSRIGKICQWVLDVTFWQRIDARLFGD